MSSVKSLKLYVNKLDLIISLSINQDHMSETVINAMNKSNTSPPKDFTP